MISKIILLHFSILFCLTLLSQDEKNPTYRTKFFMQEIDGSTKKEITREEARTRFKMSMLSYANKTYFVVSNKQSLNIFSSQSIPRIIVQFEDIVDSPELNIIMIKGELVKNARKFLKSQINGLFKIKDISGNFVKLVFERVDSHTFSIKFLNNLSQGEYTIYDINDIPKKDFDAEEVWITCFSFN
jgi:hypothetical protein